MNLRRRHLLLLVPLALAACSTRMGQLKGLPLRVELDNLARAADGLTLSLLLFNPNDHAVLVERVTFEFVLDERPPLAHEQLLEFDIAPRNRERLIVRLPERPDLSVALEALDREQRPRLGYRIDGELQLRARRTSRFRIDDVLHKVPGQSGRYR